MCVIEHVLIIVWVHSLDHLLSILGFWVYRMKSSIISVWFVILVLTKFWVFVVFLVLKLALIHCLVVVRKDIKSTLLLVIESIFGRLVRAAQ